MLFICYSDLTGHPVFHLATLPLCPPGDSVCSGGGGAKISYGQPGMTDSPQGGPRAPWGTEAGKACSAWGNEGRPHGAGICAVLKGEEGRAFWTEGGHNQRHRGQTAGMGTYGDNQCGCKGRKVPSHHVLIHLGKKGGYLLRAGTSPVRCAL